MLTQTYFLRFPLGIPRGSQKEMSSEQWQWGFVAQGRGLG